ncbi:hypothetical protein [Actinocrispum sp. NPDC049592]|uniref:hypothetical protein n=1 Tax=Actinocrispum sp. NPDC049592 TaxID=3154835 RepID=UPI00342A01BE
MRLFLAGIALVLLAACSPQPGTVTAASGKATTTTKAENPTWGKRFTWSDGLAIEVAAPAVCKPGEFAAPPNAARAVKFKITIVNGTDKPFEAAMFTFGSDAQFDGAKAETMFDSGGGCGNGGLESGTVMPGKTYTYEIAYAVGAKPGEMQLVFEPHLGQDKAVFAGQA